MDDWTEKHLCQWLHNALGITNPNMAQTIVEEKITGLVFHHSTADKLEKIIGWQLTYGELKTMLIRRDELLGLRSNRETQGDVSLPSLGGCPVKTEGEQAAKVPVKPPVTRSVHLREKLVGLLCQGEDKFVGDIHPILVINQPACYMDRPYISNNLSFLGDVHWTAVFDFCPTAAVCDILFEERGRVFDIVSTPDKFSSRSGESGERLDASQKNRQASIHNPWIFCNGFQRQNQSVLNAYEWKRKRRESFRACVRFFGDEVLPGRAVVVFCLLSEDWSVMLEGAEEFFSTFQDQWMCIVEEDDTAEQWMQQLMSRHICRNKFLLEMRVVAGLSWYQVQETIEGLLGFEEKGVCYIPMASGSCCRLKDTEKSALVDLDVLGAHECDNVENNRKLSELRTDVEERFYKGGKASWWNFWFKTHVCFRDKARKLLRMVQNILGGRQQEAESRDGFVQRLYLYHQPGAGGTTVGRNILWDLRDVYRCAILRIASSPDSVARQIYDLWSYKEATPVLILLDNEDDEQIDMVQAALEDRVKTATQKSGHMLPDIMCLLLLCRRRSRLQESEVPMATASVLLKHELNGGELEWFLNKAKQLERNHSQNNGIDPKLLISFNILKKEFDKAFIEQSVSNLLADFETAAEKTLVTFISFLNSYDHLFRPLPIGAFDMLMWRRVTNCREQSADMSAISQRARAKRWETRLGSAVLVLLNEYSCNAFGKKQSICITNSLLANEVLRQMKNQNDETVSDIAVQVLESKDLFPGEKLGAKQQKLLDITGSILKTRPANVLGKQGGFSPLIEDIRKQESFSKAQKVLDLGFRVTGDPFIAQQAARLAIVSGDWDSSLHFISMATEKEPGDPYLLDTCGRVYKAQLVDIYRGCVNRDESLCVDDVQKVLSLAKEGIQVFQREQLAPRKLSRNPEPGYLGEIDTTVLLLDCLRYWGQFKTKSILSKFMIQKDFVPKQAKAVFSTDIGFMKNLGKVVHGAMRRLDEVHLHLLEAAHSVDHSLHSKLSWARKNISSYFGEPGDSVVLEKLPPGGQCMQRRRCMLHLGGQTLQAMLDLCLKPSGEKVLCKIRDLARQNVLSEHADASDCESFLFASVALTLFGEKHMHSVQFESLVELSERLLNLSETRDHASLEAYLFHAMLHWPRNNQCSEGSGSLSEILKRWERAFIEKYPRPLVRRRPPKTMFYLGKGDGMSSIRTEVELRDEAGQVHKAAGGRPRERLKGILCDNGFSVEVMLGGHNSHQITRFVTDS